MKTINFKFEDENSILVSKLTAKKKKKKCGTNFNILKF